MKYFVYILENDKGRHYVGITTDPVRRLIEHNKGSAKSTLPFRPWKIIYIEEFESRSLALKREYFLKHIKGKREKAEIINKYSTANIK